MDSIYDNPEIIGAFLDELDEQLQFLEQYILELERGSEISEVIPKIFRVAHTLKGSSSAMGFEKMKLLTHEMEDVLDKVRSCNLQVSKQVINVFFQCLDSLRSLKEEFLNDRDNIKTDISSVLKELNKILLEGCNQEIEERNVMEEAEQEKKEISNLKFNLDLEQEIQIEQAICSGYNVFICEVKFKEDTIMKLARAHIVMNFFNQIGTVIQVMPNILGNEENISIDIVNYLLMTQLDDKTIENKVINELMEIDSIKIHPYIDTLNKQISTIDNIVETETTINQKSSDTEIKVSHTVRVDVEKLEKMMNLVGELVIEKTRVAQVGNILHGKYTSDAVVEDLIGISNQLSRVTNELQEIIIKTRMLPIKQLFVRFPRLVRDLAESLDKKVELILEGEETELDKGIIEDIADPLIHLIRNAIDHGIETPEERSRVGKNPVGTLKISAFQQENQIVITIKDDGKGIDLDKVRETAIKKQLITPQEAASLTENEIISFIFRSGFSTSNAVSDISGRGVGMDIVKNYIDKLNGIIEVETKQGEGTKFIIKLPLTLAIIMGLLIKINDETFIIPMTNVIEIVRKSEKEIEFVNRQAVTLIREKVLPLVWLQDYFKIPRKKKRKNIFIVVLGVAEKRFGLVVDELVGNQEIVVKPLGSYIGKVDIFSGATILGDGSVACILDVAGIVKMIGSITASEADVK